MIRRVCNEAVCVHKVIESTCSIGLIVCAVVLCAQKHCAHNNIYMCTKGIKCTEDL
jgi:hypothetical protein